VVRAPVRREDSNDELIEDEDSITVWKKSRRSRAARLHPGVAEAGSLEDEDTRSSLHFVRGSLKEVEAQSIKYETNSRTIHVFRKNRRVKF
jgi:hypothetical protein